MSLTPLGCCATIPAPSSCASQYSSPTTSSCSSLLEPVCGNQAQIFYMPACKEWATLNQTKAFKFKENYCGQYNAIFQDYEPHCIPFVRGASGLLDSMMFKYCNTYPSDPLCSCYVSPIPCPKANDKNCITYGYKDQIMLQKNCSSNKISCSQFKNLSPSAQALVVNPPSCSSTSSGSTTGTTSTSGSTTGTTSTSGSSTGTTSTSGSYTPSSSSSSSSLYIEIGIGVLIFVLLLVIIMVIVIAIKKHKKSNL